ncbi:MAG: hypothetical protein JWO57_1279, partial [Pseudonocardiales bacterium]|nr:hypothetical protein [Pseudonocardiales bacterium]
MGRHAAGKTSGKHRTHHHNSPVSPIVHELDATPPGAASVAQPRPFRGRIIAGVACVLATLSAVAGLTAVDSQVGAQPATSMTQNVRDSMSRGVAHGLGTADVGGAWTTSSSNLVSVSHNTAHVSPVPGGRAVAAHLPHVRSTDQMLAARFTLPSLPRSGGGVYLDLDLRRQANGDLLRAHVRIRPDGRMSIGFSQVRAKKESAIGGQVSVPTIAAAGRALEFEASATGTTSVVLQARLWQIGRPTPSWQLTHTAARGQAIAAPGDVGFTFYTSTTTPASGLSIDEIDGWRVLPPSSPPSSASTSQSSSPLPSDVPTTTHPASSSSSVSVPPSATSTEATSSVPASTSDTPAPTTAAPTPSDTSSAPAG